MSMVQQHLHTDPKFTGPNGRKHSPSYVKWSPRCSFPFFRKGRFERQYSRLSLNARAEAESRSLIIRCGSSHRCLLTGSHRHAIGEASGSLPGSENGTMMVSKALLPLILVLTLLSSPAN